MPAEEVHPARAETYAAGGAGVVEREPGAGQQGVGGGAAVQGDGTGVTEPTGSAHDHAAEVDGRRVESIGRGEGQRIIADLGQGLIAADHAAQGDVARGEARQCVDPATSDAGGRGERNRTSERGGRG